MRRLTLSAAALAASVSVSSSAFAAPPRTIYVRADGNDACTGTLNLPSNAIHLCAKRTIQAAVNAVAGRGTVKVGPGTFVENVVLPKSVSVVGSGKGKTFVLPALSAPAPCENSSLCNGQASNVFLVKASDVKIQALTIDGDNPAKTGVTVAGGDVDARNGIIEDHLSGIYKRLIVEGVEVKNVYLRGINAASEGGGFRFADNVVTNVRGSQFSVGIFAFGGPGTISGNHVSLATDAIGVNQSRGVKITGNLVEQSASGIHIDNDDAPAPGVLLDLIEDNEVSDCTPGGLGIWFLLPRGNAVANSNQITQCDVGLALFGGGAESQVTFSANTVTGTGAPGSTGIYVSTDALGWGHFDTEALFTVNTVTGFETAAFVGEGDGKTATVYFDGGKLQGSLVGLDNGGTVSVDGACFSSSATGLLNHEGASATVHGSHLGGSTTAGIQNLDSTPVNATENWWGSATGPAPSGSGAAVLGPVTSTPHLATAPFACE